MISLILKNQSLASNIWPRFECSAVKDLDLKIKNLLQPAEEALPASPQMLPPGFSDLHYWPNTCLAGREAK